MPPANHVELFSNLQRFAAVWMQKGRDESCELMTQVDKALMDSLHKTAEICQKENIELRESNKAVEKALDGFIYSGSYADGVTSLLCQCEQLSKELAEMSYNFSDLRGILERTQKENIELRDKLVKSEAREAITHKANLILQKHGGVLMMPSEEDKLKARLDAEMEAHAATLQREAKLSIQLDELEKQEPVAVTNDSGCGLHWLKRVEDGALLYTRPVPAKLEGSEWQPIETAPKDGTVVLGYDPGWYDIATPMSFDLARNKWMFFHITSEEIYASHWMPMPAAPKQGE